MKKLFLICLIFFTCNPRAVITAQKSRSPITQSPITDIDSAFAALQRSKDTTAMLITDVKKLATQKIVYRTKIILRIDTVYRVDTCIAILQPIDSQRIAILFQNRIPAKKTKAGRIIEYIFHPKKSKSEDPEPN